jgi:16S rRNA (guanine966-N2)-methyltransferase
MRITGGEHRGRVIEKPKGKDVRPTSDKVRQAIFNMLKKYDLPEGAQVLDVCCGTGALGLDAISRGAVHCTFVDNNRASLSLCQRNSCVLGFDSESCTFLHQDMSKAKLPSEMIPVSGLLFLDPPYKKNLVEPMILSLSENGWLGKGCICVIEAEKNLKLSLPKGFVEHTRKNYGDTQIIICQWN